MDGIADLSLRPLAERVGTSARLLIYHFGSKEDLLAAALAQVRARIAGELKALAQTDSSPSLGAALARFWRWATAEPNRKYFRLLFEIDGLAMHDQLRFSTQARNESTSVWLNMIRNAEALSRQTSADPPGRTRLIWASIAGLLQDFLTTGDHERTTEALHYFLGLIAKDEHAQAD
ncbi:TetR family transcriptional regulator [Bradyrhizobium genosp. P]|uniref:TetR family transcriptional regulator n=1 Tax=Bradyrhizobium genosp. P TaxID=83641 RepID=UPI003CF58375